MSNNFSPIDAASRLRLQAADAPRERRPVTDDQEVAAVPPRADVHFDGLPAEPPESVLDEIDAQMDRLDALKDAGRSLRFDVRDPHHVRVEVLDGAGEVVRRVPPMEALQMATEDIVSATYADERADGARPAGIDRRA
ncbi:hypothetical protein [Patulibacter sp. SYSU D01012]|uniref:hypothetical protein n=1 Tax=Patulibacter sp. SYSU D01012 TaxID=2817381 RepID=UPI001B312767|nr:hypothetical protein [Patulibacter sp. SYSU D01012]